MSLGSSDLDSRWDDKWSSSLAKNVPIYRHDVNMRDCAHIQPMRPRNTPTDGLKGKNWDVRNVGSGMGRPSRRRVCNVRNGCCSGSTSHLLNRVAVAIRFIIVAVHAEASRSMMTCGLSRYLCFSNGRLRHHAKRRGKVYNEPTYTHVYDEQARIDKL